MSLTKPLSREDSIKITEMAGATLIDGAFYQFQNVGHFEDIQTRLHFPGCRAIVDPLTRKVMELQSPGPPQQLPVARWCAYDAIVPQERHRVQPTSIVVIAGRQMCKIPFTAVTFDEYTSGLTLALRTGTIVHIDNETMKKEWPEQWAARKNELVHDEPTTPTSEAATLFDTLMQNRRVSLAAEAAARQK